LPVCYCLPLTVCQEKNALASELEAAKVEASASVTEKGITMQVLKSRGLLGMMLFLLAATSAAQALERSVSPEGARVYIIAPADGALVNSPVTVKFGLQNMGVAPAGVDRAGTGHHHLLIDLDMVPELNRPLPATDNVKHFGKGQTETVLELSPGVHSLQLLMGNYLHVPHQQAVVSEKITITVH
jgi:hypothetical protein